MQLWYGRFVRLPALPAPDTVWSRMLCTPARPCSFSVPAISIQATRIPVRGLANLSSTATKYTYHGVDPSVGPRLICC
jgi:hypothetical protein